MPGIRQDFAKGMVKDMYEYYWDGEKYDTDPVIYTQIFQEKEIDSSYWQTTSLVDMEEYEETPETEGYVFRSPVEGYTPIGKVRTFTVGRAFTEDAVEDHQKIKDIVRAEAEGWGRGKKRTMEKFYAKYFNYGGLTAGHDVFNGTVTGVVSDASGDGCYDGTAAAPVPFFALTGGTYKHTSKGGTTYYNGLSSAFTADNLETLYKLMTDTNSYNENDERINIIPDYIMFPTALQFSIRRTLESTLIPGVANNDKNVLQNILDPIMNPYLTDTDAWFIGKKKKGLYALIRRGVVNDFYHDQDLRQWKAVSSLRFGGMVTNWRFHHGSNFSTT